MRDSLAREVGRVRHLLLGVLRQFLSVPARAHPAQSALGRHVPLQVGGFPQNTFFRVFFYFF